MEPLAPIPTPPAARWREFRIQVLPVLTFIVVLACVVVLWGRYVVPTNMVGEVEMVQASVISAVPGTVREVKVKRFQRVQAGEEIAVVSTMDTATLQASLRAAEADLKLMLARMQLDVERNNQSYLQTRLDYLSERAELASERVRAYLYQREADRQHRLLTNQPALTSETEYEKALLLAETSRTNVVEREKYLAEKEKILPSFAPSTKTEEAVLEAIKGQEALLQAEGQITSIKAPIDGVVSAVNVFPGSKIVENLPLAVISSTEAARIIGYVRRPYSPMPKPGDTVLIRRQSFKREAAPGTVLEVSGHLLPISTALVPIPTGASTNELGLPFAVSIPPQLALLPGEAVDLMFERK